VRETAEILGMRPPKLLSRPNLATPLAVAPMLEPTLYVSLPAVEAHAPDLLPVLIARRLAELRPELVAHALFRSQSELRTLLKGALHVAVATQGAPPQDPEEATIAAAMEPTEAAALRIAVEAVVGTRTRADVGHWHLMVDLSTARVAFLLAGDLDVAWRAVQAEPQSPAGLTPAEWRAEMLRFAVSDEMYDLRAAIGVSVESRM
jgi:hypothetical protein